MNTSKSNAPLKLPMRVWRGFQHWRAMRIYARVVWMAAEAERLTAKADQMIGKNVKPPMPLFDRDDSHHEGR